MTEDLGRYRILEELGRGGFAIVHRAYDMALDRFVALKELRPTLLPDTEWVKRFKREAKTIASLDHLYIVPIYDVVELAERLFIVMRLVDGLGLDNLLATQGPLPWSQALAIITAVADALDYAHAQGILHRDLKPANILIDRERGPLLSDFGLAKLVSEASTSVTAEGGIVGTPHYIAPEVWEGEGTSPQSDIYALGGILYEVLTGEKAIKGNSPPMVMMAHFSPLELPEVWPEGVPSGVAQILQKALAKKPDERYATAAMMATALTKLTVDTIHLGEKPVRTVQQVRQEITDIPAQLPSFFEGLAESTVVETNLCVARERELAQLNEFLSTVLTGRGRVVFVTGEAGQGKTCLLNEFALQAQSIHPNLVVTSGICDVYTGVSDPYLPFRDVMGMLTGDVETRWIGGAISRDHALRLWHLFPHTVQALLDYGSNLIDSFVPGAALEARARSFTAEGADWLMRLRNLLERQPTLSGGQSPDQSHIFEEYTSVLKTLATGRPLLLILDDLHWADLSSISLLAHLARRIEDSPILIIGAYRQEDVAQGRAGEPHPLEGVLSELKRYFGDIWLNLQSAGEAERRKFVDAWLDTQPNRLGEKFRQELTWSTGGHPLFTIELLRDMQERGDVRKDEEGRWVARPDLNWDTLPARVEGVIEKRIDRLDDELREVLTVASVEGEEFTAEVIARVQAIDERVLMRRLSGELNKRHRLVAAQGIRQLGPGGSRLSRYRFRHNLFQKYLYNTLDEVERAYQHEAVGNTLEQLYGEQTEEIAGQLARHFQAAGQLSKAVDYLQRAGDTAARVYANTEAEVHYNHALEIAKAAKLESDQVAEQLRYLYTKRGRSLELNAQYDQALRNYEEMETLALERGDRAMELASLRRRAIIRSTVNPAHDPVQGQVLLEKARSLARQLGDRTAEAKILWNLLLMSAYTGGDLHQRIEYGEQALALARELNLREQMAFTLNDIFYAYAGAGQWTQAREALNEARELWHELGNLPMLAETLMRIHWAYLVRGDYEQAITYSEEAFRIGQESNNLDAQALSRFMIGFVYLERGQPDKAIAIMTEAISLAEAVENLTPLTGTRSDLGWVYGLLGTVERGLELARLAQSTAEEKLPILRYWPRAILVNLHLLKGDLAAAEAVMATLEDYREIKLRFGYLPFMWVRVGLAEGEFAYSQQDFVRATKVMDELYTDLRDAGIRFLLPDVLHLKGKALLEQGPTLAEEARETLVQARAEAEALGSRRALWPILITQSEIERQYGHPAEAEALRKQAQEIVDDIANHIGMPELRTSFLNLPQVKAVLSV